MASQKPGKHFEVAGMGKGTEKRNKWTRILDRSRAPTEKGRFTILTVLVYLKNSRPLTLIVEASGVELKSLVDTGAARSLVGAAVV